MWKHSESSWHLEGSPKCYLLVIFKIFVSSAWYMVGSAINICWRMPGWEKYSLQPWRETKLIRVKVTMQRCMSQA